MLGFSDKVLLDNAYESWSNAVKYANLICDGLATFGNKKMFVSCLHNAVELFLKQIMIDENDYRVGRPKNTSSTGNFARDYYNCKYINTFFLNEENSRNFISEDFKKIIDYSKNLLSKYYNTYPDNQKLHGADGDLTLLNKLRNSETHFSIHVNQFLAGDEFARLYNFMLDFSCVLEVYDLKVNNSHWHCESLFFPSTNDLKYQSKFEVSNFSYRKQLANSGVCQKLYKMLNEKSLFAYSFEYESSYYFVENILKICHEKVKDGAYSLPSENLYTYVKLMEFYKIIEQVDTYTVVEVEVDGVRQDYPEPLDSTIRFNI